MDTAIEQLKNDSALGETLAVELKLYNLVDLKVPKKADDWRSKLAKEIAALGIRGGSIYIGVKESGEVIGVEGTSTEWDDSLLSGAKGKVKPRPICTEKWIKINKSIFPESLYSQVIKVEVSRSNEPIHYVNDVPIIRDGTDSRPATPEEVKEVFRRYFMQNELVSKTELEQNNLEYIIYEIALHTLVATNLYNDYTTREADVKLKLLHIKQGIRDNLSSIKANFGEDSVYAKSLFEIYVTIESLENDIELEYLGAESGAKWDKYMESLIIDAKTLIPHLKTRENSRLNDEFLVDMVKELKEKALLWLHNVDDFNIKPYFNEAESYAEQFLIMAFQLYFEKGITNQTYKSLKEIGDFLQKNSRSDLSDVYHQVISELDKLRSDISLLA
jgi:hypothetical protein